MRKFYEEQTLLAQTFVIDGESKVKDVVAKAEKDAGAPIKVVATPTPKASVKPTPVPTPLTAKAKPTPTPKPTPKPTPILKLPVTKTVVRTETATKPEPVKGNTPNVQGRSLREVASLCSQAGLKLKAIGSGTAKSQRRVGDTLVVEFK